MTTAVPELRIVDDDLWDQVVLFGLLMISLSPLAFGIDRQYIHTRSR